MKYVIVPQSDIDKLNKERKNLYKAIPTTILDTGASWRIINRKYTTLPNWLRLFFRNLDGEIRSK